jgi:membrane protein YqaA with SNARE-associated domain
LGGGKGVRNLFCLSRVSNPDTVYREFYNEMRRYRDYEFQSSTWYTAMLIAILGFLISVRFGKPADLTVFGAAVANNCLVKLALILGTGVLGGTSWFLVRYASHRYEELRKYANELEPEWKVETFVITSWRITPRHVLYVTQVMLVLITWFVILIPSY